MHTSLHQSTSGAARHVDSHHSLLTFCSVPFWLGRQPAGLLAALFAAGVTEGLAAGLSLGHMHTPLHQSASGVERHVLSHQSSATFWSVAGSTAHFCPSTAPPASSARAAARSLAASACAQAERSTTARAVGRRSGMYMRAASELPNVHSSRWDVTSGVFVLRGLFDRNQVPLANLSLLLTGVPTSGRQARLRMFPSTTTCRVFLPGSASFPTLPERADLSWVVS